MENVSESNRQEQLTIGKILKQSIDLLREFWMEILIITAIVYIPLDIVYEIILTRFPAESVFELWNTSSDLWSLFELFVGVIATMAVMFTIQHFLETKERLSWQEALKKSVGVWPQALTTQLLQSVFLAGLFILLVVPGIIYSIYWAFIIPVIVVVGKKNKEALDISKKLVTGNWWKIFWWLICLFVCALVFWFLFSFLFELIFSFIPEGMALNVFLDFVMDFAFMILTIGSLLIFRHLYAQQSKQRVVES